MREFFLRFLSCFSKCILQISVYIIKIRRWIEIKGKERMKKEGQSGHLESQMGLHSGLEGQTNTSEKAVGCHSSVTALGPVLFCDSCLGLLKVEGGEHERSNK